MLGIKWHLAVILILIIHVAVFNYLQSYIDWGNQNKKRLTFWSFSIDWNFKKIHHTPHYWSTL